MTLNRIAILEPISQNWPEDLKLTAKRLLGECLVCALEEDLACSEDAFERVEQYIKSKSKQVSRYWTLYACLLCGLVAATATGISSLISGALIEWLGRTPYQLAMCFLGGCIGAVFFVIVGSHKSRQFNSSAERDLHNAEAIARITSGGIAGLLVGCVVKLQLFLPAFSQSGSEMLAMYTVALIAGASERLAVGIVMGTEESIEPTHGAKHENETSVTDQQPG